MKKWILALAVAGVACLAGDASACHRDGHRHGGGGCPSGGCSGGGQAFGMGCAPGCSSCPMTFSQPGAICGPNGCRVAAAPAPTEIPAALPPATMPNQPTAGFKPGSVWVADGTGNLRPATADDLNRVK